VSDQVHHFHYEGEKGLRLDKYLVNCLPDLTRSRLQGLVEDGFVRVDGVMAVKSGMMLQGGESVEVRIPPPEPAGVQAEEIPLQIVFENDDLMIINKPAGMVVHPAAGHSRGTLINAALAYAPEIEGIGGEQRPGVVHRLDKDTSGLILMAKNDRAHQWLQEQFRSRQVEKTYLALVDGKPPTPQGRIEAPVGRDPSHRKQMAVVPESRGRAAVSEYRTRTQYPKHTLLEVHPITGRTHQIRLHMAFLGCPIVGDTVYGHRTPTLALDRQFLHAWRIRVVLPGEEQLSQFEADLPSDLADALAGLKPE
jgi:23S rRNA pseudouridine1911/1915/1917 synthase